MSGLKRRVTLTPGVRDGGRRGHGTGTVSTITGNDLLDGGAGADSYSFRFAVFSETQEDSADAVQGAQGLLSGGVVVDVQLDVCVR